MATLKRMWIFLSNTFEVVTRKNLRKMFAIGSDHLYKLKAEEDDPDIATLLVAYVLVFDDFRNTLKLSNANKGRKKGTTNLWEVRVAELIEVWVPAWANKVEAFYPKKSPEHIMIFPETLSATFNGGTYEEILLAVETLADVVKTFDPIKSLEIDIMEKYAILNNARLEQSKLKGKTSQYSDLMEEKRLAMADILFGNLGYLIYKFQKNPAQVERFFKMSLLRRSSSNGDAGITITDTVAAGSIKAVTFPTTVKPDASTTYTLTNQSTETTLWMFFAPTATTLDSAQMVVLEPNLTAEATALDLGWAEEKPFLIVRNIGIAAGDFEIVVFIA